MVFGVGNTEAEVLFIGEGPGANEDLQGEPFVGRGGQLLDKMLAAVGLSREKNIYIANIVKAAVRRRTGILLPGGAGSLYRLAAPADRFDQTENHRLSWRVAACRLISPDFKVTREHGQFVEKNGVWMMGTLHPAAVLRVPTKKPEWFEDFIALREKIGQVCTHTELVYPE